MQRTTHDARRDTADYLIENMGTGLAVITPQNGAPEPTGRGVKRRFESGRFEVTLAKLTAMRATFQIMTNF